MLPTVPTAISSDTGSAAMHSVFTTCGSLINVTICPNVGLPESVLMTAISFPVLAHNSFPSLRNVSACTGRSGVASAMKKSRAA
jgi:hypothetical protein